MGVVLVGALAGAMFAAVSLFLGAGWVPAFLTYVVVGMATSCGIMVAMMMRPIEDSGDAELGEASAPEDTMAQWMADGETQIDEDEDRNMVA